VNGVEDVKNPVRLGLYGCGNRTRALLNSLRGENEYQVVAAYDICGQAVASAVEQYGGKSCTSSKELIAHDEAEAFLISLDPFAHPAAFDEAVEARRPIFIEKPIAMSAQEAWKMWKKAERLDVPVQVGFIRRFTPEQMAARAYLINNPPGRIFGVSCNWFHPGETEMINCLNNWPENFRLKVSQIPFHCCHALDVLRTYCGEVKTVHAVGVKWVDRPYPSPDKVVADFVFENSSVGAFHYSSMSYKHEISYVLHAENYTLTFDDGLEIWHRPQYQSLRNDGSPDCRDTYHKHIGPDRFHFGASSVDATIMLKFLRSVRDGLPMDPGMEDGYRVAELAEAIETSWRTGERIDLPLTL